MTFHPGLLLGEGVRGLHSAFAFLSNLESNKVTAEFRKGQKPLPLKVDF